MATLLTSCNNNPDYAKNLATAQKLFQLHEEENLEAQLALVSEKWSPSPLCMAEKQLALTNTRL